MRMGSLIILIITDGHIQRDAWFAFDELLTVMVHNVLADNNL